MPRSFLNFWKIFLIKYKLHIISIMLNCTYNIFSLIIFYKIIINYTRFTS